MNEELGDFFSPFLFFFPGHIKLLSNVTEKLHLHAHTYTRFFCPVITIAILNSHSAYVYMDTFRHSFDIAHVRTIVRPRL